MGLQIFRAIGGIFLIEMVIGNQPGIFAYPAGVGDIIVALIAVTILINYKGEKMVPGYPVLFLIGIGMVDFVSAFFFGFTSSPNPFQLFHPDVTNQILLFPTGMIPLFLVPYAIFFHTLSFLNYRIHDRHNRLSRKRNAYQDVCNTHEEPGAGQGVSSHRGKALLKIDQYQYFDFINNGIVLSSHAGSPAQLDEAPCVTYVNR